MRGAGVEPAGCKKSKQEVEGIPRGRGRNVCRDSQPPPGPLKKLEDIMHLLWISIAESMYCLIAFFAYRYLFVSLVEERDSPKH